MKACWFYIRSAMTLMITTVILTLLPGQTTFYTIAAGDWNDPDIWSNDNVTPCACVPSLEIDGFNVVVTEAVEIPDNLIIRDSLWIAFPQLTLLSVTCGDIVLHPGAYLNAGQAHIQVITGNVYNEGMIDLYGSTFGLLQGNWTNEEGAANFTESSLTLHQGSWENIGGTFLMESGFLFLAQGDWTNEEGMVELINGDIDLVQGDWSNTDGDVYFTNAHLYMHADAGDVSNSSGMVSLDNACIEIMGPGFFVNDQGQMMGNGAISAHPWSTVQNIEGVWETDVVWCGTETGSDLPPMECCSCTGPSSAPEVCAGIALGFEFISVDAFQHDGLILIRWRVGDETTIQHYLVERSRTGKIWNQVAHVPASGQPVEVMTYEYTDIRPLYNENLYRIAAIGWDGNRIWSPIRTVTFLNVDAGELSVYPNPMREGEFIVHLGVQPVTEGIIEVFDLSGRRMYSRLLPPGEQYRSVIIEANWPAGSYLVQYTEGANRLKTHLVISYL